MFVPVYAKIDQVLYETDPELKYIFPFTLHIGMAPSCRIIEMEKTY